MNNNQLCHDFFHSEKRYKRGNSMYYNNNTIYSYSTAIGLKPEYNSGKAVGKKEYNIIYINSQRYSNTTSKHQSYLYGAIPHNFTIITIPEIEYLKDKSNHEYFIKKFEDRKNRFLNSRCQNKEYDLKQMGKIILSYEQYLEVTKQSKKNLKKLETTYNKLNSDTDYLTEQKDKYLKLIQKKREQEKQREIELINKFRQYEINWINSEFQCLRIKQDDITRIETSKGYTITTDEFKRLYKIYKRNPQLLMQEKVERSIEFQYINDNKLIIGCHKITFKEIENFYLTINN